MDRDRRFPYFSVTVSTVSVTGALDGPRTSFETNLETQDLVTGTFEPASD